MFTLSSEGRRPSLPERLHRRLTLACAWPMVLRAAKMEKPRIQPNVAFAQNRQRQTICPMKGSNARCRGQDFSDRCPREFQQQKRSNSASKISPSNLFMSDRLPYPFKLQLEVYQDGF